MNKPVLKTQVEHELKHQKVWHRVSKQMFKKVPETYYVATPYLRLLRDKRKWSLREMAERAGVSVNYYHDFERGKVRAGEDFVKKVKNAFKRKAARSE